MKVAPYPLPKPPKSDKPMADNPNGEKYPFADEGVTNGIREATLTAKPYPIKGWFVYSTNILYALPNPAETLKAIDKLDLLVVIDTMPSEITGYADVVLPEVTFFERYEQLQVGYGRRGLDIAAPTGDAGAAGPEGPTGGSRSSSPRSSAFRSACRLRTSRTSFASASRNPE